jgi:hypothetical protein
LTAGANAKIPYESVFWGWEAGVKTKLLGLLAGLATACLASIGAAAADTIKTFDVDGSFVAEEFDPTPLPLPIPLTGTLTIDVTQGVITASDLLIPTFAPLNVIDSQGTSPNITGLLYELKPDNSIGDSGYIDFIYPLDLSNPLIGHNVIDIDQGEFTSHLGPVVFGLTGTITAVP